MPLSTRFPVAVHVLAFLAATEDGYASSSSIAKSVAANPAAIRKLLRALIEAGLASSQKGIDGGAQLARPAMSISLLDIYSAVETKPLFRMHSPQLKCPLTKGMLPGLEHVFDQVESSLRDVLASQSLEEISREGVRKFREKFG